MRRLIREVCEYSNSHKGLERVELVTRLRKYLEAIALGVSF